MVCPICKKPVDQQGENARFYPFCSDRCKLVDLGRWLRGTYQVPAADTNDDQAPNPPKQDDAQ